MICIHSCVEVTELSTNKQHTLFLNDVPELQVEVTSTFQFTDDTHTARFHRAEVNDTHCAHLKLVPHTTVSSVLDELLTALPEAESIPEDSCIIFEHQ